MTMETGLLGIEFTGLARLTCSGLLAQPENPPRIIFRSAIFRPALVWLSAALIVGAAWMLLSGYSSKPAEGEPVSLATAVAPEPAALPVTGASREGSWPDPVAAPAEMTAAAAMAPVNGLRIASQSWRRGGLGSKALVTLTLRNGNDYPVKDIEISCAFARRNGSHLTDRIRRIHDTINTRSRKSFARLHVGFVNVNADRAKCSLLTASRL